MGQGKCLGAHSVLCQDRANTELPLPGTKVLVILAKTRHPLKEKISIQLSSVPPQGARNVLFMGFYLFGWKYNPYTP